jgi:hypothetical protein
MAGAGGGAMSTASSRRSSISCSARIGRVPG